MRICKILYINTYQVLHYNMQKQVKLYKDSYWLLSIILLHSSFFILVWTCQPDFYMNTGMYGILPAFSVK